MRAERQKRTTTAICPTKLADMKVKEVQRRQNYELSLVQLEDEGEISLDKTEDNEFSLAQLEDECDRTLAMWIRSLSPTPLRLTCPPLLQERNGEATNVLPTELSFRSAVHSMPRVPLLYGSKRGPFLKQKARAT